MIIASVRAGHYLLIEDDRVVGNVQRVYAKNTYYPEYVYLLTMANNAESKTYRNLSDMKEDYEFDNYPGYNAILKTQKEKARDSKRVYRNRRNYGESYVY